MGLGGNGNSKLGLTEALSQPEIFRIKSPRLFGREDGGICFDLAPVLMWGLAGGQDTIQKILERAWLGNKLKIRLALRKKRNIQGGLAQQNSVFELGSGLEWIYRFLAQYNLF